MRIETATPLARALSFEGRRCLVTGGARGLGRAVCAELTRRGAQVAFTYPRSDADAEDTRAALAALGREPLVLKGSVTDPRHAASAVKATVEAYGGLDVLVCNAGLTQVLPLALIEEEELDEVLAVNVKGAFHFARAAARHMIRAKAGRILFVGNFGSERPLEAPVHVAAAKSALRGLTDSMAKELGRYGITVNLVAPGLMERGLADLLPAHRLEEYLGQCPLHRLATFEEVVEALLFLCSDAASLITGAKLAVHGGL